MSQYDRVAYRHEEIGIKRPHAGHCVADDQRFGLGRVLVAYSIDAFKPNGVVGNYWVVTDVSPHALSQSWTAP